MGWFGRKIPYFAALEVLSFTPHLDSSQNWGPVSFFNGLSARPAPWISACGTTCNELGLVFEKVQVLEDQYDIDKSWGHWRFHGKLIFKPTGIVLGKVS